MHLSQGIQLLLEAEKYVYTPEVWKCLYNDIQVWNRLDFLSLLFASLI